MELTRPTTRRDAIKIGGLTVSLGAFIAACGDNRGGSEAPGRVGNAPVVTDLPTYAVDDVVLLRTASSLEYTAIATYERALELPGALPDSAVPLVERLIENHQGVADEMVELTTAAVGLPWTCANPWFMERLVEPVLAAILTQPNPEAIQADVITFATALENFATASHQELSVATGIIEARTAHARAAALEARHASMLAITKSGAEAYISPALLGEDVAPDDSGQFRQFVVGSVFGSTAQIEIKAGPANEVGVRTSYTLQTPADNSLIYNELACDA